MGKYLIGADPEVFVMNPNSGEYVGAMGLIPGDKHSPWGVKLGAVQVDGMAAEFNIDPAEDAEAFVTNIREVFGQLRNFQPGYRFDAVPTCEFSDFIWSATDPNSKELGCDPDYNAWTGGVNVINREMAERPIRTGSGHIHIGWTENRDPLDKLFFAECCDRAKQLDFYLGIYSLLWDPDNRRRSLYGKAGAFRPKPYGLEYRVLSNAWLNSEMLQRWIYRAAIKAMEDYDRGDFKGFEYGNMAQEIINDNVVNWQEIGDFDTGLINPPRIKMA